MCFPSTCSTEQVETALRAVVEDYFHQTVAPIVPPPYHYAIGEFSYVQDQYKEFGTGDICAL